MIKQSSRRSLRSFRSLSFRRKCAVRRSLLHLIASLLHLIASLLHLLHRYCTCTSANHVPRHAPTEIYPRYTRTFTCARVETFACLQKRSDWSKTGQNGQTGQKLVKTVKNWSKLVKLARVHEWRHLHVSAEMHAYISWKCSHISRMYRDVCVHLHDIYIYIFLPAEIYACICMCTSLQSRSCRRHHRCARTGAS